MSLNFFRVCCRTFEKGSRGPSFFSPTELHAAADAVRLAVQQVSSGACPPATCQCRRDIFLHWFPACGVGRGVYELHRASLPPTYFPPNWDRVVDAEGQGLQVRPMTSK